MDFLIFADDLTGAYDIAVNGKAYNKSIKVIWNSEEICGTEEDLIICTGSREKNRIEAGKLLKKIALKTQKFCSPNYIYMKVDSLLRGNIVEEVKAVDLVYDFDYVVIDLAYPSLGRAVCDGVVYIKGKKIQDTDIIHDFNFYNSTEEFIRDLKKAFCGNVQLLKYFEEIEEKNRILFFDTEKEEDFVNIIKKINKINGKILWVGSIGLYMALLKEYYESKKVLCVIGSVTDISKKQIMEAESNETSLVKIEDYSWTVDHYVQQILTIMKSGKNVILYSDRINRRLDIDNEYVMQRIDKMCTCIYKIAKRVIEKQKGINLIISGGETAMRLLSKKDITHIDIVGEIEKSVPILVIHELGSKNYSVVIKSGRVGDEQALSRYIKFMSMYSNTYN